MPHNRLIAATLFPLLIVLIAGPVRAADLTSPEQLREELAYTLGVQAVIYGYPYVEMYKTRYLQTEYARNPARTRLNRFAHAHKLRDHNDTNVVSPNSDTLYSSAWLDLADGPIVLSVPDSGTRYRVFQFMDFATNNFAAVGTRANGNGAGDFAIAGPGWKGTLPQGMKRIDAPTNCVWLLARTLVDGPEDLEAARALQERYELCPLAAWGKKEMPEPPERKRAPYDFVNSLKFFEHLNAALCENPPSTRDAGLLGLLALLGVGPNCDFRADKLDPATARGLRRAVVTARQLIDAGPRESARPVNGWLFPPRGTGRFGEDYLLRATTAMKLLGALPAEEAVYPTAHVDDRDRPLSGEHRYVLRFDKAAVPPVDSFWSVTMYRLPQRLLADNPLGRYAIGDRTKGLKRTADGALEILVQRESPGREREANWLPCPPGNFCLTLRAYLPRAELLDGKWQPPAVKRVD